MLLITNINKKPVFGFNTTATYVFTCPNDDCRAQHTLYVITACSKRCENCGTELPPAVSLFNNLRTRLKHHGKSSLPIINEDLKKVVGYKTEKTYEEIIQETLHGDVRVEDAMQGWGIPFNMED